MKKWEHSEKAELIPVIIDSKRYKKILADIAELLYEYWAASSIQNSTAYSNRYESSPVIHCKPAVERTER